MKKMKIFISELVNGKEIESVFIVRRKEVKTTKTGSFYLALELGDRTGSIDAKMWDGIDSVKDEFFEKDFVAVAGKVTNFRDKPQLEIKAVKRVLDDEVDLADFLPATRKDMKELTGFFKYLVEEVRNPHLKKLLLSFLNDEKFMKAFSKAPAAKSYHHAYLGGLIEHTISVTNLCQLVTQQYDEVDPDLLITAALLHDIGKIEEISCEKVIDFSNKGRFLGHIVIADEIVQKKAQEIPSFPDDLLIRLRHAILSHHGELEWGSPKRPKTLEALILHHIDNLDAKVKGYLEIVEKNSDATWSDMRNLFKRPLYLPKSTAQEFIAQETLEDMPF